MAVAKRVFVCVYNVLVLAQSVQNGSVYVIFYIYFLIVKLILFPLGKRQGR
jgi:hypothetical protein